MAYWRMQLHPDDSGRSSRHAAESLSAGFIGLDFARDRGDMTLIHDASLLSSGEKDYLDFSRRMTVGDKVLVIAHNFPFALATVSGGYNYIRTPVPEIGVWFRHFRAVNDVKYYSDWITNALDWQRLIMTDAISILKDPNSKSYQLIADWP